MNELLPEKCFFTIANLAVNPGKNVEKVQVSRSLRKLLVPDMLDANAKFHRNRQRAARPLPQLHIDKFRKSERGADVGQLGETLAPS
jgi:hypothetical protein